MFIMTIFRGKRKMHEQKFKQNFCKEKENMKIFRISNGSSWMLLCDKIGVQMKRMMIPSIGMQGKRMQT